MCENHLLLPPFCSKSRETEVVAVAYSRPCWTSKMEFLRNYLMSKAINYFRKEAPSTMFGGVQIARTAQKMSLPLRISSVNVTKSAGNCGFGHIY